MRSVLLAGLALVLGFAPAAGSEVARSLEVHLQRQTGVAGQPVELIARPADEGSRQPLRSRVVGDHASLSLDDTAAWAITCRESARWCCPTIEVSAQREIERLQLAVFECAELVGSFEIPRGEVQPDSLLVQAWTTTRGGERVEIRQQVEVRDGSFVARVPRSTLDLRLAAPGWVPLYRWGRRPDDRGFRLGEIALSRGGSLAGFVTRDPDGSPVADAEVVVSPLGGGDRADERLGYLATSTTTGPRGFFQLPALPPARYRVEITADELAPLTLTGLTVESDAETFLADQARLRPALELLVETSPAVAPDGLPWRIELRPLASGGEAPQRATDLDGLARFGGLLSGHYRLLLRAADGSIVHQEDLDLDRDRRLRLDLDLVTLVGRLRLGDEGLAADIRLQTGVGDEWRFSSDEDGRFGGSMRPPNHVLFASITAYDPPIDADLEVERFVLDDGVLEIELDLLDEVVEGLVIDEAGRPVAGARVSLDAESGTADSGRHTGHDGGFSIRVLEPGRYFLRAAHGSSGEAGPVGVEVRDGLATASVVLELVPRRRVAGELSTADGRPVPGATLYAYTAGGVATSDEAVTDVTGAFELALAQTANRVVLQVFAPSKSAWSGCVAWPLEGPLSVELPDLASGRLELTIEGDPSLPPTTAGRVLVVTSAGGFFSPGDLSKWSARFGGGEHLVDRQEGRTVDRFDGMAPGLYTVTWTRQPWWLLTESLCGGGMVLEAPWEALAPGGFLALHHDHEPHQREQMRARRARRSAGD